MTTTPQPNDTNSIAMLTLLRDIRERCETEGTCSLEAVHQLFNNAVRGCSQPTAPSNPSMSFFADWLARKCNVTTSVGGRWQMLSLDFWQVIRDLEPNDAQAYSKFWELFDEYTQLDERIVSSLKCDSDLRIDEERTLLRCELIQLHPETGVYLRSYRADSKSTLGERISNFGFSIRLTLRSRLKRHARR